MKINLGAASLNQTPLAWDHNVKNIQEAIDKAFKSGITLLALPELAVTAYGCEDYFFMEGVADDAVSALGDLKIPENMVVTVGLPIRYNKRNFNAVAVITSSASGNIVHGFVLKQNLAMNGVHYEQRWFESWSRGQVSSIYVPFMKKQVPVGDLIFSINGVIVGFEICEDAWVAHRPGVNLAAQGVDVIINPSASHFSVNKYKRRIELVKSGSASFGCAYVYANLNGCEAGRSVYDGGSLIASNGELVAKGKRLHFNDVEVLGSTVDLQPNQVTQMLSSQQHELIDEKRIIHVEILNLSPYQIKNSDFDCSEFDKPSFSEKPEHREHEETTRAVALFMYDWMRKTSTDGFMLSKSGGADSSLCAASVYYMAWYVLLDMGVKSKSDLPAHLQKFVANDFGGEYKDMVKLLTKPLLHNLYQASDNSGNETLNSAMKLSNEIGCTFHHWSVSVEVDILEEKAAKVYGDHLTWKDDDATKQNIQARVRSPGVWMLANKENKLLITTSNLSEGPVGYCTLDGDTSGVIAPVSGISKSRILRILKWMENFGPDFSYIGNCEAKLTELKYVNSLKASAELKPVEQTDEEDLMPFIVLDTLRKEITVYRRRPKSILASLSDTFKGQYTEEQLSLWIEKFYRLFSRSQVKRDRMAPGPIIEEDCLDPKTYARYPLLNSGLLREIAEMR